MTPKKGTGTLAKRLNKFAPLDLSEMCVEPDMRSVLSEIFRLMNLKPDVKRRQRN